MRRKIDAHQHYWQLARGDYHWMPTSGPLHRDYLPADLQPFNEAAGIVGTILVQAAQTLAETEFLLDLADQPDSGVLGVASWADLASPDGLSQLEKLATHPKLVSVRPMLQDLAAEDWILQPLVLENLARLPALGLRLEVLAFTHHLPYVIQALERLPPLPVVINHLAKPRYGTTPDPGWQTSIRQLAANPNVYCKLSGLVTEVGPHWQPADFKAHAHFVLEQFGPERVMFGSDWPVCLMVATHAQVVSLAEQLTAQLDPIAHSAVWGGTATRFYGLADLTP